MKTADIPEIWVIEPYVGIGPLRFGLTRSQVRSLLGNDVDQFRKGPYATNETDAYDQHGLHLYYDQREQLEAIEALGHCKISYRGVMFLNRTPEDVLRELTDAG